MLADTISTSISLLSLLGRFLSFFVDKRPSVKIFSAIALAQNDLAICLERATIPW